MVKKSVGGISNEHWVKGVFVLSALVFALTLIVVSYSLFIGRASSGFTQVYLEKDYDPLVFGGKVSFSFVIDSSKEIGAVDYNYSVFVNGKESLEPVFLTLNEGSKKIVPVDLILREASFPAKILVSVGKKGQDEPFEVWFWAKGEE